MTTKKQRMYEQIEKHGKELLELFPSAKEKDPIKLSKKLLSLENKAHRATTCLCNTNTLNLLELNRFTGYSIPESTEQEQELFFEKILNSVKKLLNVCDEAKGIFINYDPRGYALKIKSDIVKNLDLKIYQDFGGYGILGPEFRGE